MPDFADVRANLDDATNVVAAVLVSLRDQLSTGMTQAQVDTAKTDLTAGIDRLRALAADPNVPVPPVDPAFATAVKRSKH